MDVTATPRSDRRALIIALVALPLLAAVLLTAFAWPASRTAPRDVPIGLAGPPPALDGIESALEQAQPGAFDLTRYDDPAAAEQAIRDRNSYGAILADPAGTQVLTASAASPVVAQALREVADGLAAAQGAEVTVTDVVAADPDDPRGTGAALTVLPMIIMGLAVGAVAALVAGRLVTRLAVVGGAGVVIGAAGAAVVQSWLGLLPGSWWVVAGVLALAVSAIGAATAGLATVLGRVGLGLAAATMTLLGNPLSGGTSAPELLPQPWGDVGQALPPGAGATLLRGATFFDGAGSAGPMWTLLSWLAAGLLLLVLGASRTRRPDPSAATVGRATPADESGRAPQSLSVS